MSTTGVMIVDHGSRRIESNRMLERVAELFGARYGGEFALVEPAHMELCEPSIETAYGRLVERGARRVAILPFFLAEGKHWTRDIPSLASQAAARFAGTSYQLAEPLGIDDLMLELLHKRLTTTRQPIYASGEADPRVEGLEPTQRREQCTSCPFVKLPDGRVLDKREVA